MVKGFGLLMIDVVLILFIIMLVLLCMAALSRLMMWLIELIWKE